MENKIQGGLRELPDDPRDIQLGTIVRLPPLSELPKVFSLGDTIIRNQQADQNDDFCGMYGSVGMAYLQDGIEGSQEWGFAKAKELSGDPESFGLDMRTIFKVWTKFGVPRRSDVKAPIRPLDRRFIANYDATLSGQELKKQTYVSCSGPYDAFDNLRASIWKYRYEKRAIGIGVVFSWPLGQVFLEGTAEGGFGHFMFVTGWDMTEGDYLEVVNSYGREAGRNGQHLLSRETINYFVGRFGSFMLIDMPIEEARAKQEESKKKGLWNFFLSLLKMLFRVDD